MKTTMYIFATTLLISGTMTLPVMAQATETSAVNPTHDAAYWTSVFRGETILAIDIYLTQEQWNAMEPDIQDRRMGPPGRGFGGAPGRRPSGQEQRGGPPPPGTPGFTPQDQDPRPLRSGEPPSQRNDRDLDRPPEGGGPPGGPDTEFEYASTRIVINGETIEDAGLRFKGNSSYRSSLGDMKRPMKIDTDRFVDGQEFYGRTKLNLSTSFKDPAYVREKLGYDIYKAAGIPVPGVGWGTVTLHFEDTGEDHALGLYVVIEQVDKGYIERTFGTEAGGGTLFKPEIPHWQYLGMDPTAYDLYDIKIGSRNESAILRFAELTRLITEGSDKEFREDIGGLIDTDMLAGYLAASSLLVNLDSYIGMIHNYYLLADPTDGRIRLLPWDINEAFGGFTLGANTSTMTDWSIEQPWVRERALLTRLLTMPSFQAKYRGAVEDLMGGAFSEKNLRHLIETYTAIVQPLVEATSGSRAVADMHSSLEGSPRSTTGDRDSRRRGRGMMGAPALYPFIEARIASVTAQLAGTSQGQVIQDRGRGSRPDREPGRGFGREEPGREQPRREEPRRDDQPRRP